ncbi:hypothetical protein BC829DRAFT_382910, partial [Chytridium lagenaria]
MTVHTASAVRDMELSQIVLLEAVPSSVWNMLSVEEPINPRPRRTTSPPITIALHGVFLCNLSPPPTLSFGSVEKLRLLTCIFCNVCKSDNSNLLISIAKIVTKNVICMKKSITIATDANRQNSCNVGTLIVETRRRKNSSPARDRVILVPTRERPRPTRSLTGRSREVVTTPFVRTKNVFDTNSDDKKWKHSHWRQRRRDPHHRRQPHRHQQRTKHHHNGSQPQPKFTFHQLKPPQHQTDIQKHQPI